MAGTGGARVGAGRPAKADKFAGSIADAEQQICDKLPSLVNAMLTLAVGHKMVNADGEVYDVGPSYKAIEYCMNRVMGRPLEQKAADTSANDTPQILGYTVLLSAPPKDAEPDPTLASPASEA